MSSHISDVIFALCTVRCEICTISFITATSGVCQHAGPLSFQWCVPNIMKFSWSFLSVLNRAVEINKIMLINRTAKDVIV